MRWDCGNEYQAARSSAGLTQEQAAERLGLAVRTLADYEAGRTTPQPETVCGMVELYDAPLMGVRHVCMRYPFLRRYLPAGEPARLPEAVIRLVNLIYQFARHDRDRTLMEIAEDGVIDSGERPEFDAIMDELSEIVRAALLVDRTPRAKKDAPASGCDRTQGRFSGDENYVQYSKF